MKPIERLDRRVSYHGHIIDMYTDTVKLPNGKISQWDYLDHVGAAAVVPVLPDGRILLVKQYRNALDRFTLEIPAGKLDYPGEPMEQCAARELEEETGYRAGQLESLLTLHTWIAFCNEKVGVYVAKNLEKTAMHLDEEEDIQVEVWELKDLLQRIYAGEMTDAKTVASILAYAGTLQS